MELCFKNSIKLFAIKLVYVVQRLIMVAEERRYEPRRDKQLFSLKSKQSSWSEMSNW